MTYEVVKRGEWPHKHSYPPRGTEPPGTVIECECGQRFMLKKTAFSGESVWRMYPEVPPPAPPMEER